MGVCHREITPDCYVNYTLCELVNNSISLLGLEAEIFQTPESVSFCCITFVYLIH